MLDVAVSVSVLAVAGAALLAFARLRTPSRRYRGPVSVADVYDLWTREQFIEFYWSDHLHAGHYGNPPVAKDFVRAKLDMIDEIFAWGIAGPCPEIVKRLEDHSGQTRRVRILDVGCGLGGSARALARRWPATAHVVGITLSGAQTERATTLSRQQGTTNTVFLQCDALAMAFPDASFDIVWAVESESHIPDKEGLVREMMRVLKPGGALVMTAVNVRDTQRRPFSRQEIAHVRFIVDEWCHTDFVCIRDHVELFQKCGLVDVAGEDWTAPTLPSWRQAVVVPMRDPRGMTRTSPLRAWAMVRDVYMLLQIDRAFRKGLCEYGLLRGRKPRV